MIEVIDILSTLKDPLMRLQALAALERGEFYLRPCIWIPLSRNLKIARAVAKIFKKKDLQKYIFGCKEFCVQLDVSDYHI